MQKPERETLAQNVGSFLATVQHVTDLLSKWAFQKMKNAGEVKEKAAPGTVAQAKRIGRGVLKIVGDVGSAYMRKYEELKRN